jgi:hypothetical protein
MDKEIDIECRVMNSIDEVRELMREVGGGYVTIALLDLATRVDVLVAPLWLRQVLRYWLGCWHEAGEPVPCLICAEPAAPFGDLPQAVVIMKAADRKIEADELTEDAPIGGHVMLHGICPQCAAHPDTQARVYDAVRNQIFPELTQVNPAHVFPDGGRA